MRRRRGRSSRLARLVLGSLAVGLALTGCAGGIDRETSVQPGLPRAAGAVDPIRVVPPGPVFGARPDAIVRGFLEAGAARETDLDVARSFLTARPRAEWRPDSGLLIYDEAADLTITKLNEDSVVAQARLVASIDGAGRYRDLRGEVTQMRVGLASEGGQWRISELPQSFGRWISRQDLDGLYRAYHIHYVSTAERLLIPDVRWFALDRLATQLARAQLDAVPDYLEGAARTDVPSGTRLAVDAVPVVGGVATIDLTATGAGLDKVRRQDVWAQFLATMQQVPGVQQIAIQIEGTPFEVPGLSGPVSTLTQLDFSQGQFQPRVDPILRIGEGLVEVDPNALQEGGPLPTATGPGLPTVPEGWFGLALSASGQELAAIGGDRKELSRWRGTEQVRARSFATQLSRPTYDRYDVLWVGGRGTGRERAQSLWAINTATEATGEERPAPVPVSAPWLGGRRVVAVRVSPEGSRVALATVNLAGAEPRVEVAGVVRAPTGLPQRLSGPLTIAATSSQVHDLVWVDPTRIVVLGRRRAQQPVRPYEVKVGGQIGTTLGAVPGAVAITTTGGVRGLAVVTDRGSISVRAGGRWQTLPQGTDLAVAGV